MTVGNDVMGALVARLKTIKTAAGYANDINRVFWPMGVGEQQPMGMDIAEHELPAIIAYQGPVDVLPEHHINMMSASIYLELVNVWSPDNVLWSMVADVGKAIFGGSSTATENTGYRFHPAVQEPRIEKVIPDFGMLPTHRIWVVCLLVQYRARYTNL